MEVIRLEKTNSTDILQRKCIECGTIFESDKITCPKCGSKKTTCSFTDEKNETK